MPLAAGRWPLAAGRWPLAAGRWPLAAGRWPLAAGRWPLAAGRWPLAAGRWPLAAGRWPLAAGRWPLAAGRWPLAAGRWPLAAGRWPLAAGRWPLAAGRWPLAAGRWPLAAGRWPLAAGNYMRTICGRGGGRCQGSMRGSGRNAGCGGRRAPSTVVPDTPACSGAQPDSRHSQHGLPLSTIVPCNPDVLRLAFPGARAKTPGPGNIRHRNLPQPAAGYHPPASGSHVIGRNHAIGSSIKYRVLDRVGDSTRAGRPPMSKSRLGARLADAASMSGARADAAESAVFAAIAHALARDGTAAVAGLGKFAAVPARQGASRRGQRRAVPTDARPPDGASPSCASSAVRARPASNSRCRARRPATAPKPPDLAAAAGCAGRPPRRRCISRTYANLPDSV